MRRLVFYDIECFQYFWCITFIDYNTRKKKIIKNDRQELIKFYMAIKDKSILVGFNNRHYDSPMLKAIIIGEEELGWTPYQVSRALINDGLNEYQISKKLFQMKTVEFDCMTDRILSLKQCEAMMGSSIEETEVPFDLDRPLTCEEIEMTIKYNIHDVEETIKVFELRKSEFEAQVGIIQQFNMPITDLIKTKARLTASALGAKKLNFESRHEDYEFLDCIKLTKYAWIRDWYDKNRSDEIWNPEKGKMQKSKLVTNVYGVECTFARGGVHGSVKNYYTDNTDGSLIVHSDVALI